MEFILLTNLAFSVVGFVFIFRMWREVKERRDYYGENFAIPMGVQRQAEMAQDAPCVVPNAQGSGVFPYAVPAQAVEPAGGMSMEQLTAMVVQALEQQEKDKAQVAGGNGDMDKLIAAVAAQSGGGK